MRPRQRQRLIVVVGIVALAAVAVGLLVYALRANMNLFYTPEQIVAGEAPSGHALRAGGVVKVGSVQRAADSLQVSFVITDFKAEIDVRYDGMLPDLFREGQGVVVTGQLLDKGHLQASQVLAKHDEKYTPPEISTIVTQGTVARPHNR
ncbi:cytochrome c maturation protein CcmE [Zymobacter palmae]|uniref:Cytochrome c-type biogenesis protein CcmE n=1 Tax=Zymobacter palmae TaxID=33074 RepID=A0A348HFX8_9GAMM|nr:cytochrome c maturation protein CcmE [Zymobacter palmae]BBG30530.1 cytochrome c-type biogenesis protein CcmE [Zymobacter palmae]